MGGPYPSFGAPNPPTPDKWWYKYANLAVYALIVIVAICWIAMLAELATLTAQAIIHLRG